MTRFTRIALLVAGATATVAAVRYVARRRAEQTQPFFADVYVSPAPVAPRPAVADEPAIFVPEAVVVAEEPAVEPTVAPEPVYELPVVEVTPEPVVEPARRRGAHHAVPPGTRAGRGAGRGRGARGRSGPGRRGASP